MKYSILTEVCKEFRTKAQIQSRIECLYRHMKYDTDGKGKILAERHIQTLKQWLARLDNNHVIPTTRIFKEFGKTEEHCEAVFGFYTKAKPRTESDEYQEVIDEILKKMRHATRKARIQEILYKISVEMNHAYSYDHYMIFNTLTVSDKYYKEVFEQKSKHWDNYLKHWDRKTLNHRYVAVVERGEKTHRLHIHVLHLFSDAKKGIMRDPNQGQYIPKYREITEIKKFWNCGTSSPMMVRISPNDRYGKEGYVWPQVKQNGKWQPYQSKPPIALARYMSKYLLKAYEVEKNKWRTRMTRGFGLKEIKTIINNLPIRMIKKLMYEPTIIRTYTKTMIPNRLIAKEATRAYVRIIMKKTMGKQIVMMMQKKPSFSEQLRDSMKGKDAHSSWNTIHTKIMNMRLTDISNIEMVCENVRDLLTLKGEQIYVNG